MSTFNLLAGCRSGVKIGKSELSGMSTVYLGLGSNLGDRKANIMEALERLSSWFVIEQTSLLYDTEPVGYTEQAWFLNMVCRCETHISPFDLLSLAKGIEAHLGRASTFPDAPRPIDIDILFYDDLILKTQELIIPHPRIGERAFVLVPLSEIAPEFVHPGEKRRVSELLSKLDDPHRVRKWDNVPNIGSTPL